MMNSIYGNSDFNDLLQECHLAQTSILAGFEYLLRADLFNKSDGKIYSSFFNLSIGIERFLKIALVVDYMYSNNYKKPPALLLTGKSHNITNIYSECVKICQNHNINVQDLEKGTSQYEFFHFISRYAITTRYQNLNSLTNHKLTQELHPIQEWIILSKSYLTNNLSKKKLDSGLASYLSRYEPYAYTQFVDFDGSPMTFRQLSKYQYYANTAKPFLLFEMTQALKPIYKLLNKISMECNNGANADLKGLVKLPYFGELFLFFYADLNSFKKRKKWVDLY